MKVVGPWWSNCCDSGRGREDLGDVTCEANASQFPVLAMPEPVHLKRGKSLETASCIREGIISVLFNKDRISE